MHPKMLEALGRVLWRGCGIGTGMVHIVEASTSVIGGNGMWRAGMTRERNRPPTGQRRGRHPGPTMTGENHATNKSTHRGADETPYAGQARRAPRSLHRNAGELAQRRYRTEVRSTLGGHPLPCRRGREMDRRRCPIAVAVNRGAGSGGEGIEQPDRPTMG